MNMANMQPISPGKPMAGQALMIVAVLAASISLTASAAPPAVHAGEWRMTWLQQSITGRQGIPLRFLELQTLNESRCLNPVPALPLPPGIVSGCNIDLESAVAETVSWRGTCGNDARVAGRIAYRGAAMDGTLEIDTDGVALTYSMKGSWRRAACP